MTAAFAVGGRPCVEKFPGAEGKSSSRRRTQHLRIVRFHLFQTLNEGTSQTNVARPNAFKCQQRSGSKSLTVSVQINAEKRNRVSAKFGPKF